MADSVGNIVKLSLGDGEGAAVKLEGDFVFSVGLRPNVNRVRCSCVEFDKIKGNISKPGTVTFVGGDGGDVAIGGIRVVDVMPGKAGVVDGQGGQPKPVDYVLFLADARVDFVSPFGGFVCEGLLNRDANDDGYPDGPIVKIDELIKICCKRMGFEPEAVPTGLEGIAPPPNQRWFGVPAEPELGKLLQSAALVLGPTRNGKLSIFRAGDGQAPTVPAGRLDSDTTEAAPNRRGKTLILCSAPSAVIDTIKATGPGATADVQFVMPDPNGVWRTYDEQEIHGNYFSTRTPEETMRVKFQNVPETHLDRVKRYIYRAIRLNPDKCDPLLQKVLRSQVAAVDGKSTVKLKGLNITARRMQKAANGNQWKRSREKIPCNAELLLGPNVILVSELLGDLDGDVSPDEFFGFKELGAGDIEVQLSVEAAIDGGGEDGGGSRKVPEYAYFGFTREDDGGVTPLGPEASAAKAANPGPATIFMNVPGMRRVRDKVSNLDNLDALKTAAAALAAEFFQNAGRETRTIVASGFFAADLNGKVNELRYSQQNFSTTIIIDRLDDPTNPRLTSSVARSALANGGGAGGFGPSDSLALGSFGGGNQPVVALGPSALEGSDGGGVLRMTVSNASPDDQEPRVVLAQMPGSSTPLPVFARWAVRNGDTIYVLKAANDLNIRYHASGSGPINFPGVPSSPQSSVPVQYYAIQTNAITVRLESNRTATGCYKAYAFAPPPISTKLDSNSQIDPNESAAGGQSFEVTVLNLAELKGRSLSGHDLLMPIPGGARRLYTGNMVEQADTNGFIVVHIDALFDRRVTFKITGGVNGVQGAFNAKSFKRLSTPIVRVAGAKLVERDLGTLSGQVDVIAWCVTLANAEVQHLNTLKLDNLIATGDVIGCTGYTTEDQVVVEFNLGGLVDLRHKLDTSGQDGNIQGTFRPSAGNDNDYLNLIPTKGCPEPSS